MVDPIDQHLPAISTLCREYDVELLELFGSRARGDFDPVTSDFDFLVAFNRRTKLSPLTQMFEFEAKLEHLLGAKIDLVDIRGARNPYFIAQALKHRRRLYAA